MRSAVRLLDYAPLRRDPLLGAQNGIRNEKRASVRELNRRAILQVTNRYEQRQMIHNLLPGTHM
jgi:hypothetical protein